MFAYNTLIDVIEIHKKDQKKGITFIKNSSTERFLSYSELYHKAYALLQVLQDCEVSPKSELIIQVDDNELFILIFWACILGGIIPVPVSVGRNEELQLKVFKIWDYLNDPYMITQKKHFERLSERFPDRWAKMLDKVVCIEDIFPDSQSSSNNNPLVSLATQATISPDDIAFIQFSSGSTGTPKGVVLTHKNLLVNIYDMIERAQITENDKMLSWMPLTHDMGLIAIHLTGGVIGLEQYLMPTSLFIRRPLLWIEKASEKQVTMLFSPNFGYKYFLNNLKHTQSQWDLSNVRVIYNGAEPISATLYERFFDVLAPYGLKKKAMYPCYGLAEASVAVSLVIPGESMQTVTVDRHHLSLGDVIREYQNAEHSVCFVDVGPPISHCSVRIADEHHHAVGENIVGCIEIKGNNVTSGYYNNPTATAAIMAQDGWLNTQDLGFMRNGRLFIIGRIKDIIFVGGQNYYSHDLERVAESIEGIELGKIAFVGISHEDIQDDEIVAFVVSKVKDVKVFLPLAKKLKKCIHLKTGLTLNHVLPIIRLPKTTSGKVQLFKLEEDYKNGKYDYLKEKLQKLAGYDEAFPASPVKFLQKGKRDRIVALILQQIEKVVGYKITHLDKSLVEMGIQSMQAPQIQKLLKDHIGIEFPVSLIFDYPTVNRLAAYILQRISLVSDSSELEGSVIASFNDSKQENAIAVIGMACRFPGGADTPEKFWENLESGIDAVQEIPSERWKVDEYYDPTPGVQGKIQTRHGYFLEDIERFDAGIFGISPLEARFLDPQQRLLLEVCWEALENAGVNIQSLEETLTGVFIGISSSDYAQLTLDLSPGAEIKNYALTGIMLSTAAGRISYTFGFQGPAIAIDTACSSSLVAVCQAVSHLRTHQCDVALAGGVNLMLSPINYIGLSGFQVLSTDGRCKTFDDAADGYGRGEGCGIIVLKRLADARRDGDTILAVISGSAVNHDGKSSGLTVPNGVAQERVIRTALNQARIRAEEVDYIETHGTGTKLGDPQEIQALANVFGQTRPSDRKLLVGSVKTNIGHLESAAGIAGLIKVMLALQKEKLPQHLHFQTPNTFIPWERLPIAVTRNSISWGRSEKPRIAGVSSFGLSGTNAHVIVEEAPVLETTFPEVERPEHLLTLSAKTGEALQAVAGRYEAYLAGDPDVSVGDICYTANTGRSHFSHRLGIICSSASDMRDKLAAFLSGQPSKEIMMGHVQNTQPGFSKIAFLFTGQGAQYVGMGRQLYETQPTFRQTLERCDELLRPYLETPLLEVLYTHSSDIHHAFLINQTAYTQPALFALEYALAQLWLSWDIRPDVVLGHSIGEYAAACLAGVFSLEDGLRLVAERGRFMQSLPEDGQMVAILVEEATVLEALRPYREDVSIAAINGPASVVISGKRHVVEKVTTDLAATGIKTKPLTVSHAFHSPMMEPMLEAFREVAATISYAEPQIDIVSNLTGRVVSAEMATPEYWVAHIRQPVRFANGVETLLDDHCNVFLEIGPKPLLLGLGRQLVESRKQMAAERKQERVPLHDGMWLPSLRPGRSEWQQMFESLGALYVEGIPIDWTGVDRDYPRSRVALPTYPFQRQRYWIDPVSKDHQAPEKLEQDIFRSPLINLLEQGDIKQLAHLVEESARFSKAQKKMLPEIIEAIVKQHQHQVTAATMQSWLYQIAWEPALCRKGVPPKELSCDESGIWLIFADHGGVGQTLSARLHQHGQTSLLVYAGERFMKLAPDQRSLNPTHKEEYEQLWQEVRQISDPPLRGVIHLWSLDAPLPEELTADTLAQTQRLGCGSLLHLTQTLAHHAHASPDLRLWVITRGAMPVLASPEALSVAQAPVWGLGKVIALEYPALWGGLCDLDPERKEDEIEQVVTEVLLSDGEDHLAFRDKRRYVARLVRSPVPELPALLFHAHATYVITGGLGALGLNVAQWMVDRGARHLVLIGRHGITKASQKEAVDRLETSGANVVIAHADVSKAEDLQKVFTQIETSLPPLKGVVHGAGVLDDGVLFHQTWERFATVMAPKVQGAWNLHALTRKLDLDFVLYFSSMASVVGAMGQGNYVAANAFLDALSHYRRALQLPALSINWGPWADNGMAAGLERGHQQRLAARGFKSLTPEQGLQVLGKIVGCRQAQVGVLIADWAAFADQPLAQSQQRLLGTVLGTDGQADNGQRSSALRLELLQRLKDAPLNRCREMLVEHLQTEVARILGFEDTHIIDPHQGFMEMGMDSLMNVELKTRLESSLNCTLPSTIALEYPTLDTLAEYIGHDMFGWKVQTKASQVTEEQRSKLSLELEQLSETEVEASIAAKLSELEMLFKEEIQ